MLNHVVVVTDNASVDGGSARVALGSACALAERGIGTTVFAAAGGDDALASRPNLRVVNTHQGEALRDANRAAGAMRGWWNPRAAREMGRVLATLDPARTIVHVHGWTKALSSSVVARASRAGFPVVVTLHEYFAACPNGCLYRHRDRAVCTLTPLSFDCVRTDCDSRSYPFKLYRVGRQVVQRTAGAIPAGVSAYVTVSPFSRAVLEPLLPAGSRFHAVDNPVDATPGPRVAAEANAPYVFVGRLSAEKGGALLADAARRANVPVVFVGDGAQRAEIERANPAARITGWLASADVAAELRAARCVVVPSLWYETLGLVVLEAAALGIPAIVPEGTAPRDLVEPGVTGLAFARGDAGELADRLATAADDARVAAMSHAAYARFWQAPPTMERHVDRLLAVYDEVLAAPRARAERSA